MYESFYSFKQKPFALTPNPDFLFMAPPHRQALTILEHALFSHAPFCLLTGEVGSGKTTLIRHLLRTPLHAATIGVITNTSLNFGSLLQWVCMSFGLDHHGKDNVSLYELFTRFLDEQYTNGSRAILIVDEAQNLGRARLEELRVLSNVNVENRQLLQIILVGQPELRAMIRSPQMLQLAQRIEADYHLGALTPQQARLYIFHRLHIAGGRISIFTDKAIQLIFTASRGIPRLINKYCELGLICAFADGNLNVNSALMLQIINDERTRNLVTA